ncbi:MAG: hypothetical protein IKL47_05515 [Clostridia bacterium]|nr:hypothetical protein [Clostridia bacterium]
MKNKHNKKQFSDNADSFLAAPYPTASSDEFVPKPLNSTKSTPSNSTNEIFDFIPELKTKNKYTKENSR